MAGTEQVQTGFIRDEMGACAHMVGSAFYFSHSRSYTHLPPCLCCPCLYYARFYGERCTPECQPQYTCLDIGHPPLVVRLKLHPSLKHLAGPGCVSEHFLHVYVLQQQRGARVLKGLDKADQMHMMKPVCGNALESA